MWNNLIGQTIRRSARKRIRIYGLILAGVLVALAGGWHVWYGAVMGPETLTAEQVIAEAEHRAQANPIARLIRLGRTSAEVPADKITELTHYRILGSNRYDYLALKIGNRILVAEYRGSRPKGRSIVGVFERFPAKERSEIGRRLGPDESALIPAMLSVDDERRQTELSIFLGMLAAAAGLTYFAGNGIRWLIWPETHPLAKSLSRWGEPAEIADQIESERTGGVVEVFGPAELTLSWLIWTWSDTRVGVMRVEDIVWHFHGSNANHYVVSNVHDRHGVVQLGFILIDTARLLHGSLYQRVPWAYWQDSHELRIQWQRDYRTVVARVDERKTGQPATGASANQPAGWTPTGRLGWSFWLAWVRGLFFPRFQPRPLIKRVRNRWDNIVGDSIRHRTRKWWWMALPAAASLEVLIIMIGIVGESPRATQVVASLSDDNQMATILLSALGFVGMGGMAVSAALVYFWPALHPLARSLRPFGSPRQVADDIEAERAHDDCLVVDGEEVTRHWLIHYSPSGATKVVHLDTINLIRRAPMRFVYDIVLVHHRAGVIFVALSHAEMSRFLQTMFDRAPHIVWEP